MGLLQTFLTTSVSNVVDSIGNALDSLFTSDEERLKAKETLEKIKMQKILELQQQSNEFEKEITKRWISDNQFLLPRLVRPSIVIFIYSLFGIIVLADGNIGNFHVNPAYIDVIETILVTVTVAYFGSRGFEKIKGVAK